MLPEPLRLLISAYASGDVSPQRRKAAVRLLTQSAEARQLLKAFRQDIRKLRELPHRAPPPDFADRVLRAIPHQPPIIQPTVMTRLERPRFSWMTKVAVAASVLLPLSFAAYLFWTNPVPPGGLSPEVTHRDPELGIPDDVAQVTPPQPFEGINKNVSPRPVTPKNPSKAIAKAPSKAQQPPSLPNAEGLLGGTLVPPPELIEVAPSPLMLLPLRGFELAENRKMFLNGLAKADNHRIDLFCRDTVRAFERFQAVCQRRGLRLIVEPIAQEELKLKLQDRFIVYTESLSATEWTNLLLQLNTADKQAEQRRPGDGLFDQVVFLPFTSFEQRELTTLMGADPTLPPETRPSEADTPKEKLGLVLPYTRRPIPGSREVKQFLENRRERTPGSVTVMLVLRLMSP